MSKLDDRALEAAAIEGSDAFKAALRVMIERDPSRVPAAAVLRDAIVAYLDALQETHALVPREATEEMESAFFKARDILRSTDFPRPTLPSYTWSAMIDAAPPAAQDHRP